MKAVQWEGVRHMIPEFTFHMCVHVFDSAYASLDVFVHLYADVDEDVDLDVGVGMYL